MKHFKISRINADSPALRTLPQGRYYGFAVGPDGMHRDYTVTLNGQTHVVSIGAPLVLDSCGVEAAPLIAPRRVMLYGFDSDYCASLHHKPHTSNDSTLHVLAMTCPADVQAPLPLALCDFLDHLDLDSAGETNPTDAAMFVVPFAGRDACLMNFDGTVDQIKIYGIVNASDSLSPFTDWSGYTPDPPYELLEETNAAGLVDIITQDVGAYDSLLVTVGDGTAMDGEVRIRITG